MAPKRARVVGSSSRGRSLSGSDSSSGDDDMGKFRSDEARAEYVKLMTRSVAKDRIWLPIAADGEIVGMIQERGWQNLCELTSAVPLSIVREFYANAKETRDGYSIVRGFTVDYTAPAIRLLLGLPDRPVGAEDWTFKARSEVDLDEVVARLCVPGTTWKLKVGSAEKATFASASMNRYARAWNSFICANLLPTTHTHEVTVERAILLWAILNGHYIDVGYLVNQSMLRFLRGSTGAVPYGSLVTRLCSMAGVTWSSEEQIQMPAGPIDLSKLVEWPGGIPHPRGLGYEIAGAPPVQQAPVAISSASHDRRMMRRMDALYESQSRFSARLTQAFSTAFGASGAHVEWPVFGSDTVYPPPDSPPEEGDDAAA